MICLFEDPHFRGVGAAYADFHQLTDEETIGHLRRAWTLTDDSVAGPVLRRTAAIPPHGLQGDLALPPEPRGVILFAHGSGSSRLSPRNREVAERLNQLGFATLLMDLLSPQEAADRRNVFDIPKLAERLIEADLWIAGEPELADLPLGLFGASTGAAAALLAAAELGGRVSAVISRGGRPDLAEPQLGEVTAPTLLIVGGNDLAVLELNRRGLAALSGEKLLRIVPGAGHLFEAPGELEAVTEMAGAWFQHYLTRVEAPLVPPTIAKEAPAAPEQVVRAAAEPLPDPDDPDFGAAFDRFGAARAVLLGEASHGTSEFYRARAAITRRLIEVHGFNIVAVEADWPDAAFLDRRARGLPERRRNTPAFARFPTWMWRNRDVDDFIGWLSGHNAALPADRRVRFQGLDIYSMSNSIAEVLAYLDAHDPAAAVQARRRYGCLVPWSNEPAAYGRAALARGHALCEEPVTRVLVDLLTRELSRARRDGDSFFDAVQNARVVSGAERYYRVMYYGSAESWNLRDMHMFQTLKQIMDHVGPDTRAVVWAHNSHVGDASVTDMGVSRGELNIGQLCREEWGSDAALIGFGTHSGTVACASDWDGPMEIKSVRPSRPDSHEAICHAAGRDRFLLDLRKGINDAASRRDGGSAAGTVHRRHLPPRNRAMEPLQPCNPVRSVRRLCLVRPHAGGDPSASGAAAGTDGNLSFRSVSRFLSLDIVPDGPWRERALRSAERTTLGVEMPRDPCMATLETVVQHRNVSQKKARGHLRRQAEIKALPLPLHRKPRQRIFQPQPLRPVPVVHDRTDDVGHELGQAQHAGPVGRCDPLEPAQLGNGEELTRSPQWASKGSRASTPGD